VQSGRVGRGAKDKAKEQRQRAERQRDREAEAGNTITGVEA
jgi:hypothetical protein